MWGTHTLKFSFLKNHRNPKNGLALKQIKDNPSSGLKTFFLNVIKLLSYQFPLRSCLEKLPLADRNFTTSYHKNTNF